MKALHVATEQGSRSLIQYIIDAAGGLVDFPDAKGQTALMKAITCPDGHDIVELLLDRKANPSFRDSEGRIALHFAAMHGHIETIALLIRHDPPSVQTQDPQGWTALAYAAYGGHLDAVEALIQAGSDVTHRNRKQECIYDIALTAEQTWIASKVAQKEPQDVEHAVEVDIVWENQRYQGLPLQSFLFAQTCPPKERFSAQHLLRSDLCGPFSNRAGNPCSKESIHLPTDEISIERPDGSPVQRQRLWYWLTDWQMDLRWRPSDQKGWQYAVTFKDVESSWTAEPIPGQQVRRRRWYRIRRRRVWKKETVDLEQSNQGSDYIRRAQQQVAQHPNDLHFLETAIQTVLAGARSDTNADTKQQALQYAKQWLEAAEKRNATSVE
jgi:hypothetical protein